MVDDDDGPGKVHPLRELFRRLPDADSPAGPAVQIERVINQHALLPKQPFCRRGLQEKSRQDARLIIRDALSRIGIPYGITCEEQRSSCRNTEEASSYTIRFDIVP